MVRMGLDIYGWVEVRYLDRWWAVVKIDNILSRNYEMFSLLFGVDRLGGVNMTIAGMRGFPDDASTEAERDYQAAEKPPASWITYEEIENFDWNTEVETDYIHIYKDGKLVGKVFYTSRLTEDELKELHEKGRLEKGGLTYITGKIRAKDLLSRDWEILLDLMGTLAKHYGSKNVRLVVWFD
ncbi:hypothetical protein [Pyrococcus kukulkanii]|uniref:hypothetical protein n=1 Tax=Pyrococcus kukulkanii TaxID=1609559 RepID=UPI003568DA9C